jgi:hypothetical protein
MWGEMWDEFQNPAELLIKLPEIGGPEQRQLEPSGALDAGN